MNLVRKLGSVVTSGSPKEAYASATADGGAGLHEPAPAGALWRPERRAASEDGDTYIPQRGSYRSRLQGGIPRSVAGRIIAGSVALVGLGMLTLVGAAFRHMLLHDDRFTIDSSQDIVIQGNQHLTRPQLLAVFGADLERNIFKVPLEERRADLERLPWVEHATVMRLLPNELRVAVTERTPVAFLRQGSQIGLVDASGVLLDMPPEDAGDPQYRFPVLTGLAPTDSAPSREAKMEIYRKFMADLDSSNEHLTENLSEVDVTNPEDVKAVIANNGSDLLVHFGDEDFLHRYHEFSRHLPEWRQQYPKLASADMRYERQVVLEMQPGSAVPVNNDAAPAAPTVSPYPAKPVKATGRLVRPEVPKGRHPTLASGRSANNARVFAALRRARGNR